VFKSWFSKRKPPITGAPAVRRMKTYSAQTGYVYQYYYDGHRPLASGEDRGVEFVFSVSPDRINWHTTAVVVSRTALRDWEDSHQRRLSSNEQYAIAKMALFQAFDERTEPAQMQQDVHVRAADVEAIVERLGL
jgi:hypothetical protein